MTETTTYSQQPEAPASPAYVRRSEAFFRALLWLVAVYGFALWAVALVDRLTHPLALSPYNSFDGNPLFAVFAVFVGAPITALLGYLVLRKQRQNLVGLLLLVWAGGFASYGISVEIAPALYGLVSLPIAAWWTALIITPFYFPDGHAYPRWLSPILPALTVVALIQGGAAMFAPSQLPYPGEPANPFFVAGAETVNQFMTSVYYALALPLIIGVFVSPLLRYRHAGAVQRQQIKAFAFWSMIILTPYLVFYFALTYTYSDVSNAPPALQAIGGAFIGLIGLFPPIVIAYSILRYRLYDIDVVIRKTLVYSVLTALLALVYFGIVVLLQAVFGRLAGVEQSTLAVVISTLAIAALFTPLRRRIQDAIDRRFYRKKYNAQQVLAQFTQTARDETDLDALLAELVRVVDETLQPEHVSIWLKDQRK